jgi:hypothetical protein
MHARLLAAITLALVLAACGQDAPSPSATSPAFTPTASPTAVPSPSVSPTDDASPGAGADAPAGWRRIGVAEQGFSLAVPDAWQELSPALIADSGLMDDMRESNPDAAGALEQAQAAIEQGSIALFAFDTDEERLASGFASNLNAINVGSVGGSAEEAADEVAEAIRQQIPITGEVETSTTSLPAGDAAVLTYEWELAGTDGAARPVHVTQYAIIGDSGSGFILSMSAMSDAFEAYQDVFVQIAESFREE